MLGPSIIHLRQLIFPVADLPVDFSRARAAHNDSLFTSPTYVRRRTTDRVRASYATKQSASRRVARGEPEALMGWSGSRMPGRYTPSGDDVQYALADNDASLDTLCSGSSCSRYDDGGDLEAFYPSRVFATDEIR